MTQQRSEAKAWAGGALVTLALSYSAPYTELRGAPALTAGSWAINVPEAHPITLCVAVACVLALLAARGGDPPGISMIASIYVAAVVGLALSLRTTFSYPGNPTHTAGLGVRMQGLAAILAVFVARAAGDLRKPAKRKSWRMRVRKRG